MHIGLAALPVASSAQEALDNVLAALREAGSRDVSLICTPENYLPGHRCLYELAPVDPEFLAFAETEVARVAGETGVGIILGIEQPSPGGLLMTALVIDRQGQVVGRQVKTQIDPDEEGPYAAGTGRRMFEVDGLRFGITICHEGWRYPETVRWAARRGAHIVFHPHLSVALDGFTPNGWADPRNSFHEKAAMVRAAENTIFFATVNCAIPRSSTTSSMIDPNGDVIAFQPHGVAGLLIVEIDPAKATGLLARRLRDDAYMELA